MSETLVSISAEETLTETVMAAAMVIDTTWALNVTTLAPVVVTSACLMAQQAAAIALRAAGDIIPAQAGATELMLRAANRERLPAPHTLPFQSEARQSFDRMVAARNSYMHPRGETWEVDKKVMGEGLMTAVRIVRHLIIIQPIVPGLIPQRDVKEFENNLQNLDDFGGFYAP